MSTVMGLTVELLEELDLLPGLRVLDVGTGAGVTAAVACHVCGHQGVVTLDRDRLLTDAAAARLADLDFRPQVVCGSGEEGVPGREFDPIFVSYTVERVPTALVEQLAPDGVLLAHVTSASPSWPGLAVVRRTADGHVTAELRAVEFAHRAGHNYPPPPTHSMREPPRDLPRRAPSGPCTGAGDHVRGCGVDLRPPPPRPAGRGGAPTRRHAAGPAVSGAARPGHRNRAGAPRAPVRRR
ncbi:hypothetical protein ABT330_06480 [Streptomyces sp. NPDC000658]|uniref:protein-L-isoaspartate O-methyltransferase family protein n=1 Tax=Streptomyces sp. NPDC000658 TaxID=3154266 RepID=UPI00331B3CE0